MAASATPPVPGLYDRLEPSAAQEWGMEALGKRQRQGSRISESS